MTTYNTNEFRSGLKILLDNEPCVIIESEFIKPGKGQTFARVRMRKLISNKLIEKTFKSTDHVKSADVLDLNVTYIYNDKNFWYFIKNNNYEQLSINKDIIGDNIKWLIVQTKCIVTLWNEQPIAIIPNTFVELTVIDTFPYLRGNSSSMGVKTAILNTGAIVKVPLFIQIGDIIKVDTRSGIYISRINK